MAVQWAIARARSGDFEKAMITANGLPTKHHEAAALAGIAAEQAKRQTP